MENKQVIEHEEKVFLFHEADIETQEITNFDSACLAMMRGYTHLVNSEVVSEKLLYEKVCKSKLDNNIVLLPEQYKKILELESISDKLIFFSAPTSFGKTFLMFEHIKRNTDKYKKVLFISPTLALGDEISANIDKYFGDIYSDNLNSSFFMKAFTNEEFLKFHSENREELGEVDLVVFDEVYKLSDQILGSDSRKYALSKSFFLLSNISKKVISLSPYIKIKSSAQNTRLQTDFSPTLQLVEQLEYVKNTHVNDVLRLAYNKSTSSGESNLIYMSAIIKIQDYINIIVENNLKFPVEGEEISIILNWIEKNISKNWYVYRAIESGVGVHCGPMPAFVKKTMLYLFENKKLKNIMCTSTLMEGINTNTNNVIIPYIEDKNQKLNEFAFLNLRGRAGRLGRNLIGNIYLYQEIEKGYLDEIELWAEVNSDKSQEKFDKLIVQGVDEHIVQEKYNQLYKNLMKKLNNYNLSYEWYNDAIAKAKGYENFQKLLGRYEEIRDKSDKFCSREFIFEKGKLYNSKGRFNLFTLNKLIYKGIMIKGRRGQIYSIVAPGIIYSLLNPQNYFNILEYIKKVATNENIENEFEKEQIKYFQKVESNINSRIEIVFKVLNFFENEYRNQIDILEKVIQNDEILPVSVKQRFQEDFFQRIHSLNTKEGLLRKRLLDFGILPSIVDTILSDVKNTLEKLSFKQSLILALKGKSFSKFEEINLKACGLR